MQLFKPSEYLAIDIANNFGLDKLVWNQRLDWFNNHKDSLESLIDKAENPCLFAAGVEAYREYQKGNAIGYPISLDSTSSGIQILSVLTGDISAAKTCNVYNIDTRADAYSIIFNKFKEIAGEQTNLFQREHIKKAIMTSLYGSSAKPKEIFGNKVECFYKAMKLLAPYCWELNEFLLSNWNSKVNEYNWIMPDNFHVKMEVMKKINTEIVYKGIVYDYSYYNKEPVTKGRALGANLIHSVDSLVLRELIMRCSITKERKEELYNLLNTSKYTLGNNYKDNDKVKQLWKLYLKSGVLSSRILFYLNSTNLMLVDKQVIKDLLDTLPSKNFNILGIHDCFRVHPNYGNDLRKQYMYVLRDIAKSNLLEYLLKQIFNSDNLTITKEYKDLDKDILNTEYLIC